MIFKKNTHTCQRKIVPGIPSDFQMGKDANLFFPFIYNNFICTSFTGMGIFLLKNYLNVLHIKIFWDRLYL